MLKNILFIGSKHVGITTIVLLLYGCSQNQIEQRKHIDVSHVNVDFKFIRFDNELMNADTVTPQKVEQWKRFYPSFFYYYCRRIMPVPVNMKSDDSTALELNMFKNDRDMQEIYAEVNTQYSNDTWLRKELHEALKHYRHYYPDSAAPAVFTFISAFNYQTITADSLLGIGLDYYLGSECPFYRGLNFPNYLLKRLRKEFITVNCMQGWYEKMYDVKRVKNELLSQMIYYGKMLYYTDMMVPGMHDTIKLGYSAAQVEWCKANEADIWAALIESKILYSTNMREYMKFLNDGATTSGFPKETPARIGYYIGWQIVKSYMEKYPQVTLAQLCGEQDGQKILVESKYKPGK